MCILLLIAVLFSKTLSAFDITKSTENTVFPNIEEFPVSIDQFTTQSTTGGGTHSTFILKENNTSKFILKRVADNGLRIDQFKEEVFADALYQAIGEADPSFNIRTPKFQIRWDNGEPRRISEFLPGNELGFQMQAEVAKGFIVDAFMANWDLVISGKNLWLSGDTIYRMDNGGSLRYRALGELKSSTGYDFSQATSDIYTLRGLTYALNPILEANGDGAKFYGNLTQAEILEQIVRLVALKDVILNTADSYNAWLDIKDYKTLRYNLITRLNSLKSYYYDQVQPVTNYEQAHPFAVVIPGKSSASILMVAGHDGHKKVLLGKRVRHDWWGNFGGKADDADKTLLNTAAREVNEESMGIYHVMADDLVNIPFHDLIKGGSNPDALHRMYLLNSDYQEASTFIAELKKQNDDHSKEYTEFAWVDVSDLLLLVSKNLTTPNQANEKQYSLIIGDKEVFIHHPLMDMLRQYPVIGWLEALNNNQQVKVTRTQGSIGADASYKDRHPCPPFFDPRAEDLEKIHHLMTKHMDLITEIKQKNMHLVPACGPLPEQTATDAHLKWSLEQKGHHYIPEDDQQNVYLFLKHVSTVSGAYSKKFNSRDEDDLSITPYKNAILDAMATERKMKDWFVFYHALQGQMAFIYDISTEFRNFLRIMSTTNDNSSSMHSLRALDTFFKNLANIEDFVKDQIQKQKASSFLKIGNYESDFQEMALSVNTYLLGNPRTDSSSTFDLFYDNRSISPPDYQKFLRHLLSQFGLSNTDKYFDLFKLHFGLEDEGQLLQIFIHPEAVNDIVYLSNVGGYGIYDTYETQYERLNPKDFLTALRANPANAATLLPEKTDSQEIDLQHLQARIFLKPEIMTDPSKVQIKRYFKNRPRDNYLKQLREIVREDLSHWLEARTTLPADTLENPSSEVHKALPPLQKVYRHLQEAEGKVYETIITESQYGQFLKDDNVEKVKQIFVQNPNFDLFTPIQSVDYKVRNKSTVTYPVSLITQSPRIIAMFMSEYLEPMTHWVKSISKNSDFQKKKACLLTYELMIEQGIDCYDEAKDEASSGIKSNDLEVSNAALALFAALFEKNSGFAEALEIATTQNKHQPSYHLFKSLVMKGKFFEEATVAAKFGINSNQEDIKDAAISLFEALFEKNTGFDEAHKTAMTTRNKSAGIKLYKSLVKKDRYLDQALVAAQNGMLIGDWDINSSANILFNTFFEKNTGFDEAFHVVNMGIKSYNEVVRSGVIFLASDLFKKWQNHTEAANFATKWLNSPHMEIQLCALGILTDLVAVGQGFDKAISAAINGTKNANAPTQIASITLFKSLVEKKQGLAEATAAAKKGIKSRNEAVLNASQILLATIAKQVL